MSKLNYKCCLDSGYWEGMEFLFAGVQDLFMSLCRALAASAPIWQFGDLVPCGTFFSIVTNDFKKSGKGCSESIRNSWNAINHLSSTGKTSPVLFQRIVKIRSVMTFTCVYIGFFETLLLVLKTSI